MAVVRHLIEENDVVALRERVGPWRAGTVGTAVSVYPDSALVEVSDQETGEAFDMFAVPFEQLELRWSHRTGWSPVWKPDGSLSRREPAVKRSAGLTQSP